ncbi:MAG: hypothetical protein CTY15_01700 [Methylocystis sp.]|nr:MAG: hypothetical protein CTY15_01700 [Methylocystis sp.]
MSNNRSHNLRQNAAPRQARASARPIQRVLMRSTFRIHLFSAAFFFLAPQMSPARADAFDDTEIIARSGPVAIGGMLQGSPVWEAYRQRFVTQAGRIVDTGNGAFSHSEGQGYGLLLAVAAADRSAFDKILTWTTLNLHVRNDNLAAWRWTGSSSGNRDPNNASDGDILIAWALAEAADLWSDPGYFYAALAITADIESKLVKPNRDFGPLLMPGAEGFGPKERPDGPVVNLSYWVFPAFYRLAQVDRGVDWNALMQTGLNLIGDAQFGRAKLPPDWLSLAKPTIAPAQGFEDRYGYDALRIPLYLFWADAATPKRLRDFDSAWPKGAALVTPSGAASVLSEPGYQAVAALLRCGTKGSRYPESFYRFVENQHYYPATLHMLSLMAATMHPGSCLDRRAMSDIVSPNWKPRIGSLARLKPDYEILEAEPVEAAPASPAPKKRKAAHTENRDMPDDADLFSYLRMTAGVFAVLAGFYYLLRRQGESPADDPAADRAAGWQPAPGQYDVVPRTLPTNPFSGAASLAALIDELEMAAAASVRLSRTIGLVFFEFPAVSAIETAQGADAADAVIASLAQDFRRAVRATDNVIILGRRQILVTICLLAGRKDLETVASRLTAAARRRALIEEDAPSLPVGLAMYPLDGYSGAELIDAAKRHYAELRPAQPEPQHVKQPETIGEATMQARVRKRSRRRPARKASAPQPAA